MNIGIWGNWGYTYNNRICQGSKVRKKKLNDEHPNANFFFPFHNKRNKLEKNKNIGISNYI